MRTDKSTRRFLRNVLWTMAGALAISAMMYNPSHLATASLIFILGTFQHDAMKEEE